MHWRRRIGIGVVIVVIIIALALGFSPAPQYVDVASVSRGPLQVTVEEEGKTRVLDRFVISSPVAAFARRIELDVGSEVVKGQTLVQLEPLPSVVLDPRSMAAAKARVEAAIDGLSAAHEETAAAAAAAEFAKAELERIKRLRSSGISTEEEADRARTENRRSQANLRSAKFAEEVARHSLEAAKTALQYSGAKASDSAQPILITSPIAGNILRIQRKSEGVVVVGQALIEVGDSRSLEVEVDVLSGDAVRIKPGMQVLFKRWGGEESLSGLVRLVEPVGFTKISALGVEEQRVLVISDITSAAEKWQRLGDSYRVEASFILWKEDDVLQVPASALFRYKGGWAVFVMQNGRAIRRKVDIARRSGLSAQVIGGLVEGDVVVTHPNAKIDDGTRIKVR